MNILESFKNFFKPKENTEIFFEKEGRQFNIRPIQESDRDEIIHGFESISNETRYKRFLAYKKALTESEIDFFSHPDFVNHFAYGIQEVTESEKIPFGISRFFIDGDDSSSAEFAIALRDDYHGMGLGKELLGFTVNKAKLAGVKKLYGITLTDNDEILFLLKKFGHVSVQSEDQLRRITLHL